MSCDIIHSQVAFNLKGFINGFQPWVIRRSFRSWGLVTAKYSENNRNYFSPVFVLCIFNSTVKSVFMPAEIGSFGSRGADGGQSAFARVCLRQALVLRW